MNQEINQISNRAQAKWSSDRMKPNVIIVGFPKSGTTTLQKAFEKSGMESAHWMYKGKIVGKLVYDGWFDHDDPFHYFENVDAITQLDYCRIQSKGKGLLSLWPNLDIQLLLAIRERYPDCKFILNYRDPEKTADSIARWGDFHERVIKADCPNLPKGRGTSAEIEKWINAHIKALRHIFKDDKNFMEVDITSDSAQEMVGKFIGKPLLWWGVANKNKTSTSMLENHANG